MLFDLESGTEHVSSDGHSAPLGRIFLILLLAITSRPPCPA